MHVFISWSGEQAHTLAVALRSWLPRVLAQKISAFVSSEDIAKGARGLSVIATELESSTVGIVIVTRSNLNSSWINFEAGALGKSVSNGMVAPLLLGLSDSDLDGPLKQFQNTEATDKEAVRALVHSVNQVQEDPLDPDAVNTLFDANWPSLEQEIDAALKKDLSTPEPKRSTEEILEEVLTMVRTLQREFSKLSQLNQLPPSSRPGFAIGESAGRQGVRQSSLRSLQLGANLLESILPGPVSDVATVPQENLLRVELTDDYPPIAASVLDQMRGFTKNLGIRVVVQRTDGSAVRTDEDGLEARQYPGSEDWILQLNGTDDDF
jgi:hypothetical protein